MSDLVHKLRVMGAWFESDGWTANAAIANGGADEIERLEDQVAQLKAENEAYDKSEKEAREQLVSVTQERDQLQASRDHHRNKRGVVKTARNRAIDGMGYWRERAMEAVTHIYHLLDYIALHQDVAQFDTKEIEAAREFANEPTDLTDELREGK